MNGEEKKDIQVLILDLDGTLLRSQFNFTCYRQKKRCVICHFDESPHHPVCLHFRPYLEAFFSWCQEQNYQLIIWSAIDMERLYVKVKAIEEKFGLKFHAYLSKEDMLEYKKQIEVILDKCKLKAEQVLAIDDESRHYTKNIDKCIYIKPWKEKDEADQELVDVREKISQHFKQSK